MNPLPDKTHSEAPLRPSQQAAQAGAWEWDLMTDRMKWSDECFAVFGFPPQAFEPSDKVWLNLVHPDDREQARKEITEVIQNSRLLNLEYRIVGTDGRIRWINSNGQIVTDLQQRTVHMYGLTINV